jgi:hypothetical protein
LPTLDRVTDDLNSQATLLGSRDLIRNVLLKFRYAERPSRSMLGQIAAWPFEAVDRAYRFARTAAGRRFRTLGGGNRTPLKIAPIRRQRSVSYKIVSIRRGRPFVQRDRRGLARLSASASSRKRNSSSTNSGAC